MKVLVATDKPFAKEAVNGINDIVTEAGFELSLLEKYTSKQELLDAIAQADAAIIRSDIFDKEVLDAATKLKVVVRAGAGYDNIDLKAASDKDICVMNTPGQNANAVAELVFGMVLFAVRNFYNGTSGTELMGKKLGIHAYGNVGRHVARIAKGFGMDVYAYDPFLTQEDIEKDCVRYVASAEELYAQCQYVSLHIPATKETKNSINYNLLKLMPKFGILINTARKEVVDEDDLIRLLDKRTDMKYITDILPENQNVMEQRFQGRYFATPSKMGAQTAEANTNAGLAAAHQVVDYLVNGNDNFRVNK